MCLCGSKKKLSAANPMCFYVPLCAYVVQKKERSKPYTFYVPLY